MRTLKLIQRNLCLTCTAEHDVPIYNHLSGIIVLEVIKQNNPKSPEMVPQAIPLHKTNSQLKAG